MFSYLKGGVQIINPYGKLSYFLKVDGTAIYSNRKSKLTECKQYYKNSKQLLIILAFSEVRRKNSFPHLSRRADITVSDAASGLSFELLFFVKIALLQGQDYLSLTISLCCRVGAAYY